VHHGAVRPCDVYCVGKQVFADAEIAIVECFPYSKDRLGIFGTIYREFGGIRNRIRRLDGLYYRAGVGLDLAASVVEAGVLVLQAAANRARTATVRISFIRVYFGLRKMIYKEG